MKIFWDIDETLIHSRVVESKEYKPTIQFRLDHEVFYTNIRPCSKRLIEYSRTLVGEENVHILTAASFDYAKKISELAGWNFADDAIFARETMQKHSIRLQSLYGVDRIVTPHAYAHRDNVLIDNLMASWNDEKTTLMGINPKTNYCKVEDYIGDDSDDEIFFDTVKHFLKEKAKK
jgi:hypothetical protein